MGGSKGWWGGWQLRGSVGAGRGGVIMLDATAVGFVVDFEEHFLSSICYLLCCCCHCFWCWGGYRCIHFVGESGDTPNITARTNFPSIFMIPVLASPSACAFVVQRRCALPANRFLWNDAKDLARHLNPSPIAYLQHKQHTVLPYRGRGVVAMVSRTKREQKGRPTSHAASLVSTEMEANNLGGRNDNKSAGVKRGTDFPSDQLGE